MAKMTSMCDLPYELITAIGDHLAPKWRCRLFICCKLWRDKCYLDAKVIFIACKNKLLINADINNMGYNIVSDIIGIPMVSGRTTNNGRTVYSLYNQYNNITQVDNYTLFINERIATYFNDGIKTNIHHFKNTRDNTLLYYTLYREFKLRNIGDHDKRNMIDSLSILYDYMSIKDFSRFVIALGKDAILPGLRLG